MKAWVAGGVLWLGVIVAVLAYASRKKADLIAPSDCVDCGSVRLPAIPLEEVPATSNVVDVVDLTALFEPRKFDPNSRMSQLLYQSETFEQIGWDAIEIHGPSVGLAAARIHGGVIDDGLDPAAVNKPEPEVPAIPRAID